jgi:hypothetical protein
MMAIDSEAYLTIAKDGPGKLFSPFPKRILYPWLAGTLSRAAGQPLGNVFLGLNLVALLTLAFCLAEILRVTVGKPILALLFLLTPLPLENFELAYLPDLSQMALVAAFFLLLFRQKTRWAFAVLMLCFLTRENTLLLCLFAAVLALFRAKRRIFLGAGAVLCAGVAATSFLCRYGKPNTHNLPDFLYLLGKLPYYLLLNFSGFRIWSNVRPDTGTPFVVWHLPSWLCIGNDNVVGILHPQWCYPLATAIFWLTVFGVGPLVLFYLVRKIGKIRSLPFAVELALIYGGVSFLLGPLLGAWVDRLIGYGWPAFWIAMPFLMYSCGLKIKTWQGVVLAAGYLISCWWPRFFGYDFSITENPWPCFAVLAFYLATALVLRNIKPAPIPVDQRTPA